jgi:hypothetical protein
MGFDPRGDPKQDRRYYAVFFVKLLEAMELIE